MLRHESYKPSGVKWLGNVPAHWDVQALRSVTQLKSDRNRPDLPVLSVYREYGVIRKDSRDDNHNATSLDTSTYKVVQPGDLVVNKMKAWQGSMGVSAHEGIVSPAYITCTTKPERILPGYLHYLLRSSSLIGVYNSLSYGVRVGQWDMHYEDFKQIPIPIPPTEEQGRIVTFLDEKLTDIDIAISKKERLIELLRTKKKILIHQLVTKGLSSEKKLRNSFEPWIGEIPVHWAVKKVRNVFKNLDSKRIPLSGEQRGKMTEHLYDYYGASGVIDKVERFIFDEPLILIAEDGANLVMRNLQLAFVATGKYWVNNHAHILKPITGDLNYLCNALECVDYNPLITGAAQPKLTKDALKGVSIPFPPPKEQTEISMRLISIEGKYKVIEDRIKNEINLLEEFKKSLIAHVVMGRTKI